MNIIYCFFKRGEEGIGWARDIIAASDENYRFIPFNQEGYIDIYEYWDSVKLDRLYQKKDPGLRQLYNDFENLIINHDAKAVVVCDAPPFHPDYLLKLPIYRVLFSHDDPEATYQRNIPYLHAYHHVFYVSPAYTEDMDMADKMKSCGMINSDFLPNGVLSIDYAEGLTEKNLFGKNRNIDILFIGAFYRNKMEIIVKMKKEFGERFKWYGYSKPKYNLYMTMKYKMPLWIRPVNFDKRILLHQKAKIALNIHNGYTVPNFGNQRLFYGPANGCMLLTDGKKHVDYLFEDGTEVVSYENVDELIDKCHYYIGNMEEREKIARRGYNRVINDYKFTNIVRNSGQLIECGMEKIGW